MIQLNQLYKDHKSLSRLCFGGYELIEEIKHPVPNIHVLYEPLKKITLNKIEFDSITSKKDITLKFGDKLYSDTYTFFKHFSLIVVIHFDECLTKPSYKSRCITDNAKIDYRSEQIEQVNLEFEIWTNKLTFFPMLASCFYHEMHHAYEDFQRKLKSEGDNSLENYNISSNYSLDVDVMQRTTNDAQKKLYNILYYLHETEQRALISGGMGELDEYARMNLCKFGAKNIVDMIPKTKAHEQLVKIDKWYTDLLCIDENTKDSLLNSVNQRKAVIGKINPNIISSLLSFDIKKLNQLNVQFYHFKSWSQFMNFLKRKIERFKNDFISSMSERADMLQAQMFYITPSFG